MKFITGLALILTLNSFSQENKSQLKTGGEWGIIALSVSASNTQYGLPFLRFTPIHPGFELGVQFYKNEKNNHAQFLQGIMGYFYHDLLAHAPYLKLEYGFQQKVGQHVGIDLFAGTGYAHVINPAEGYAFNESTGRFEPKTVHAPFVIAHVGFGASYLGWEKIYPFAKYDVMMIGNTSAVTSNFRIGAKINF